MTAHEELARARKVAALARAVPMGTTPAEIARVADFFAALPASDRVVFARDAGVKPPSETTWAALIVELRARKTPAQIMGPRR